MERPSCPYSDAYNFETAPIFIENFFHAYYGYVPKGRRFKTEQK
jgi:hypothetical protein